jgi:hypothetical protein
VTVAPLAVIEVRWFSESKVKFLPPVKVLLPLASYVSDETSSSAL